jgi:quinohemoprotein amine dehydrogenase
MSVVASASILLAQAVASQVGEQKTGLEETEAGIPVTDDLVIAKCGACHTPDAKGNMARISWVRTTPEGWSQAIKRMVRQNGLEITPAEAKSVVKYLATWHGLAPEEAKPVMYLPEHRIIDETNIPNESIRGGCAACHAFAQPLSWRRSKADWKLLQNLHVALYSQADVQFRRPAAAADLPPGTPQPAPGGHDPNPVTQGQLALDYIAKTAPLHTAEWAAWQSRIRAPRLVGKWLVSASMPSKGKYVGEMIVTPGAAEDEFKTSLTLRSLTDGSTIKRSGSGLVYAGYSWRGRSDGGAGKGAKPDDLGREAREVLWFSPDQRTAEGRWFWGEYQEFGFDVKLTRATAAPTILSAMPYAVKAGSKDVAVKIYGDNLPSTLAPADLDLGTGVTVTKIVSHNAHEVVASIDVAPTASSGPHDIGIQGAVLENAFPVYHKADFLKVTPETSLARLGSPTHPKGFGQFEAIGYEFGPDGKANTADDLPIGPMDVTWTIQEFMSVNNDDDKKFIGTLSPTAFFTPASDGPNPARRFSRNNYGEVWVVATSKTEKDKFGKPLSGRSYLVVTVPSYLRWDQPEVGQ